MNKNKREGILRYITVGVLFVAICLIYTGKLVNTQIAGLDYYSAATSSQTVTKTLTVKAQRGEVFDRNGVPLIKNSYSYNVNFDAGTMPAKTSDKNGVILSSLELIKSDPEAAAGMTEPKNAFTSDTSEDGTVTYGFDSAYMESVYGKRLMKILTDLECDESVAADEARKKLLYYYRITDSDGNLKYGAPDAETLLKYRVDLDVMNFSLASPYLLSENVSVKFITILKESGLTGLSVETVADRVYCVPGIASHILGRVGKIPSNKAEYYTEKGYPLDAVVGTSGVEEAFENYLSGTSGTIQVIEDTYGNVVEQKMTKEPVAGCDVYLSIDIELQKVAEKSLADTIQMIVDNAVKSGKPMTGEDADAGAITAIDINTGQVLAIASYPTYNLETFQEDYDKLYNDEKKPMLNRALMGMYQPGSTFKVGVATAALMEGVINANTIIVDKGQYKYYDDYQPKCWIFRQFGGTHGAINVTRAIQVSCNYFFYDVGRQLTIERMNKYCKQYGLGENTGIELPEYTGVLAGPEYRNENGLEPWTLGQTLSAAIGQSDNLVTPLQLSVYTGTLIDGGTRYAAHLLYQVRSYKTGETVYEQQPEVLNEVNIPANIVSVIKNAMKNVTEDDGSAARLFKNYPITIGGKTGTSQTGSETSSAHAVFTAFAPFSDPEIVVSTIIERGASGTDAGFAVRGVFDKYFGLTDESGGDEG